MTKKESEPVKYLTKQQVYTFKVLTEAIEKDPSVLQFFKSRLSGVSTLLDYLEKYYKSKELIKPEDENPYIE